MRGRPAGPLDVPLLTESQLDGLLLSIGELNGIMGSTQMKVTSELDEMTDHADEVSDPDCLGAVYGAEEPVYAGSGWTADRWIWHQRLLRCREALAAADGTPVSQIAYRWGFSDAAHFSRAFRRAFGTAPRDFRAGRGGSA